MFYSYELLCRKPNGKFTVIWLLANSRKVHNREVMKICIPDIVKDVQNFIVGSYPDHLPESIGNRFSLYLSTKLCHGIVLAVRIQLISFINELSTLSLYTKPRSTEGSKPGRHDVRTRPDGEPRFKRQKIHEPPSYEVEVDPKTANMLLEDLGIDLLDHLETNGAAVRVSEDIITLKEEMAPVQLLGVESQGFGEISAADLETLVQPQDHDGKVPAPQELPALHEPFVPVPEIEQLPGIPVDIQRPTDFPSESQIPITVTAPEDEHPPPTTLPPAPVPPPTPLPPRTRRVSAPQLVLDQNVQVTRPTRRPRKRKVPFQDEQTQISAHNIIQQMQSWEDTTRVQDAVEDHLHIDQHRYILPAQKLFRTLRNQLLPDELKNLFQRHMYTHAVPDDLLDEESHIRLPGTSSSSVPSVSAEGTPLLHPEISARPERSPVPAHVLETITEGAEVEADVQKVPHDTIPAEVPHESQIVARELPPEQPMPEEPSTVQPQKEPEIRLVSHVQEISSPKRSDEQLKLDTVMMMQKLRALWDAGIQVTFGLICPPASTDRITAMITFELLLHMHHLNIVLLRQNLHICPPTVPREPVIIHPAQ